MKLNNDNKMIKSSLLDRHLLKDMDTKQETQMMMTTRTTMIIMNAQIFSNFE